MTTLIISVFALIWGVGGSGTISIVLASSSSPHMSIANMTCGYFTQPLNHFVPRGRSPSYEQRYCVYDRYAKQSTNDEDSDPTSSASSSSSYLTAAKAPIFFYTGNESPLEQYINQTGLMWELAPHLRARVVFVEHRYEGLSKPTNLSHDCLSYSSTMQALADYARILEMKLNKDQTAPVIAFGGSYGGMLAAWFRMKYGHLVEGSIAASAPIGAFPQFANKKIDGSARVLMHGMKQRYPPDVHTTRKISTTIAKIPKQIVRKGINVLAGMERTTTDTDTSRDNRKHDDNHCPDNLKAAWPLIMWLARQQDKHNNELAKDVLQSSFSLCEPLPDGKAEGSALLLIRWAQSVWFDLAEGSFPYPSSYIPFALLHKKVDLPAWPLQAACWNQSQLHRNWDVRIQPTTSSGDNETSVSGPSQDVLFDVTYGDSGIELHVDWGEVTLISDGDNDVTSPNIIGLLSSVRDAVSIWYNITKDVTCYNISEPAPNLHRRMINYHSAPFDMASPGIETFLSRSLPNADVDRSQICRDKMNEVGSWEPLCCNDEMNLVITLAQGLGQDFFWPPSHPRGVKTYLDAIQNIWPEPCPDPYGVFGYSKEPYELMSSRLDTYYGGINMDSHSNIVFSNGLLDPWSAGGVYADDPWERTELLFDQKCDKATIQNVTDDGSVIALLIPFGGHHTDLMYSSPQDPVCVTEARQIEKRYISRWIEQWHERRRDQFNTDSEQLKF